MALFAAFRSSSETRLSADFWRQSFDQPDRVGAKGAHNRNEFNDIQAPLADLVFGNEGLMPLQPLGELGLCQSRLLAGRNHKGAEGLLFRGMDRLAAQCHEAGKLIPI